MAKTKNRLALLARGQQQATEFAIKYLSTHALGLPDHIEDEAFKQVMANVTQAIILAYARGWSDASGM